MTTATDALINAILACNPHTQLATHLKPLVEDVRRERAMQAIKEAFLELSDTCSEHAVSPPVSRAIERLHEACTVAGVI